MEFLKNIISKLKDTYIRNKGYFLILGAVLFISIIIIVFSSGTGSLFKGFIGADGEEQTEEQEEQEEDTSAEPPPTIVSPFAAEEEEPEVQENPPTIADMYPTGAISTDAGNALVIFNEENLNFDSTQNAIIRKTGSNIDLSTENMQYDEATNSLKIPYLTLEPDSDYLIIIPKETIKNNNTSLSEDINWSFSTETQAPPPEEETVTVEEIEINNHRVEPDKFDPFTEETKISYEISARTEIEIKILEEDGGSVITLFNGIKEEGEYFVWWDGKDDSNDVVEGGDYFYRITARDPDTLETEDEVTGDIIVEEEELADFEGNLPVQPVTTTIVPTTSGTDYQSNATMTIQNTASGQTAETGPGILIYALFPLGGYFLSRKKR